MHQPHSAPASPTAPTVRVFVARAFFALAFAGALAACGGAPIGGSDVTGTSTGAATDEASGEAMLAPPAPAYSAGAYRQALVAAYREQLRNGSTESARRAAARWFVHTPVPEAVPDLVAVLKDPASGEPLAATCAEALGACGDATLVLAPLVQIAQQDTMRGYAAIAAIGALDAGAGARAWQALAALAKDGRPVQQIAALRASSSMPRASALAVATAALAATEVSVRRAACETVAARQLTGALERVYALSLSDPAGAVRQAAVAALGTFKTATVESIRAALDPIAQQRAAAAQAERDERYARRTRRLARQTPPADLETLQKWSEDSSSSVGMWVPSVTLVADHAPAGHPLGYNETANAGELCEYRVTLTNASEQARASSSAYCYSFDPYVTVINRELYIPPMKPYETRAIETTLLVLVAPDAPETHTAMFFLEIGDTFLNASSGGRPIYRPFVLHFSNKGFGPISFAVATFDDDDWGESDGNGDGTPNWGERLELSIDVKNAGSTPISGATLELLATSGLGTAGTTKTGPATVPAGGRPGFRGRFTATLPSGYAGPHPVPYTLRLIKPFEGGVFVWRQTLTIEVERSVRFTGPIQTYTPFATQILLERFVVDQDNTRAQVSWFAEQRLRFNDARDDALAALGIAEDAPASSRGN